MNKFLCILVISGLLTSCSFLQTSSDRCRNTVDIVDYITIQDSLYVRNYESTVTPENLGEEIGIIEFNNHPCDNVEVKDGTASSLPVGTVVYALKGEDPSFRLAVVNNDNMILVYQSNTKEN